MATMSDLHIDISDRLASGQDCQYIARVLDIPINWVLSVCDEMMNDFESCDFSTLYEMDSE